jgi:hypothetical protein
VAFWDQRTDWRRSASNATHEARLLDEMQDSLDLVSKPDVMWREVIRPPLWLLAFIYFMFLSLVLAVWAAFDNQVTLLTWLALTLLLIVIAVKMRSEITIDERELRIGRAHIQLTYLEKVELLTPAQIRLLRTRDADPAAYLAITFWISTGVKITLKDSRDSTPYWLVSSKKSEELTNTLYRLL